MSWRGAKGGRRDRAGMNKKEKRVLGAHKIGMESRGPSSLPFSLLGFVSWLRWTAGPLL